MAAMNVYTLLSTITIAVITAPHSANAHGWISRPAARQLEACNGKALQGAVFTSGGAGSGDKAVPLGGMPGMCGDPFMDKLTERWGEDHWTEFERWECAPQEEYTAGGVLDMEFTVDAHHGGFITCNICEGDSTAMSEECFQQNQLLTVEQNHEQYWIQDGSEGGPVELLQINWQIPETLSCDHCVLMCTWWTGHHCTYPCDREICGIYADGLNPVTRPNDTDDPYPECETMVPEFGERPQIYRNCADIKINPASGPTESPTWVRPPYPDSDDCGQWIVDYEWHTDGDINGDFENRPSATSREDCIAQCDAYVPEDGGLPCNAVSYYSDSGACMKKNVGQYWPINGPFGGGTREGWIRCENAPGQRGEALLPSMFGPDTPSTPMAPTSDVAAPDSVEEEATVPAPEADVEYEYDESLNQLASDDPPAAAPAPDAPNMAVPVSPGPTNTIPEGECGDNCCPSEAPDCLCGSCGTLPPGQVVGCAADAPLTCCGDENSRCATDVQGSMITTTPNEEEIIETVGGAGDMMNCDDEAVVTLLEELNTRRENRGNALLVCDDKATGAAVNWSEMQCNAGEVASDRVDNCNLAGFNEDCVEVVNSINNLELYALRQMRWADKSMLYTNGALMTVGLGYFECDDGTVYWTVIANTDGTVAPEEALNPASDAEPTAFSTWFAHYQSQQGQ